MTIKKTYQKPLKDENGNKIFDEAGKVKTETITTEYCIDADFIPKSHEEICFEYIENFCNYELNGGDIEKLEWFVNITEKEITKKDKTRKLNHSEIKKEFIRKYFPKLVKEKELPKISASHDKMKALLEQLKKNK